MTIDKLAEIAGVKILIERDSKRDEFKFRMQGVEIKTHNSRSVMCRPSGVGRTLRQAVDRYIGDIRGHWMVINAAQTDRREFGVPHNLNVGDVYGQ